MSSDSPYFDRIRVKPSQDRRRTTAGPRCEHPGCAQAGEFRAPKGRGMEGSYWRFCADHVREYNNNYNYFSGLGDDAVTSFMHSASIGHRPTWSMGVNAWRKSGKAPGVQVNEWAERDTIAGLNNPFTYVRNATGESRAQSEPARPTLTEGQRKAFATLDLDPPVSAEEIKAQYKALVKRFHPDANGGDRSREERFRNIVQAYSYLRGQGFC